MMGRDVFGKRDKEVQDAPERAECSSWKSGDRWWSTKLDFGGGETLDNLHRSSALGAAIKVRRVLGGRREWVGR